MDAYDNVEGAIDNARQDLGIKWSEVARRAGIHEQTLLRYRKGESRSPDTARKIERVYGWPRGTIDAIAEGREPPVIPDQPQTGADEHADLLAEIDAKIAELRELSHRVAELGHKRETG